MTLRSIPLRDILLDGPAFDTFIFTLPLDSRPLQTSIQRVGLLNPVWLRQHDIGWQIVCGAKRVLAFQELGRDGIPAQTVTDRDCSIEKALIMSLEDNLGREWNPVEKARCLQKFQTLCGWDVPKLASDLAPRLGLPPSPEVVQNYLALLCLEHDIQLEIAYSTLSPGHAFLLDSLSPPERRAVFSLIQTCALSLNESREIIDNFLDLKVILKKSIPELLQESPFEFLRSGKNAREKNRLLRDQLRTLRFPRLSQLEQQFDDIRKALPLNSRIQVRHAPYFEGNHLEINLRANSIAELGEALAQLSAASANGGFQKLFDLVRGGR